MSPNEIEMQDNIEAMHSQKGLIGSVPKDMEDLGEEEIKENLSGDYQDFNDDSAVNTDQGNGDSPKKQQQYRKGESIQF